MTSYINKRIRKFFGNPQNNNPLFSYELFTITMLTPYEQEKSGKKIIINIDVYGIILNEQER